MPESTIHPIVHAVSHRHFIRGFHLTAVSFALWAVAMVWATSVSFVGLPARAEGSNTVTGRVLAGGVAVPVNKVQVMLSQQGQPPVGQPAQTNASGMFTLSNVPNGSSYQLMVQVTDATFTYLNKTINGFVVGGGAVNAGDIALTAATKTLTVNVTRASTGAAVSGVQVNAFRQGGGDQQNVQGTSDAAGAAILHSPGGTWGLNLQTGWVNGQQVASDWVYTGQPIQAAFAGDDTAESQTVSAVVQTATVTIKGKIVYADGTAAKNVGINLRNSTNANIGGGTDPSGNFSFKATAGSYEFGCYPGPDKPQYSCPTSSFTAAENETKDFGTITMTTKTAIVSGTVTCAGTPLANANVNAFPMNQNGGGGAPGSNGQTNSAGVYSLYVNAGNYGVNVFAQPSTGCVAAGGPPTSVTAVDSQTTSGINFDLTKADVTINGTIKDVNGSPVTNFFGFASAQDSSGGFGPGKQFGGPVQNGTFQILLPSSAMSHATVSVSPQSQGAQYSVKTPASIDIAANQTYAVTLVVAANDATLTGSVKDAQGNTLTTASGQIFINNESNTQFYNAQIQNGSYSVSLLGGSKWRLGYHIMGDFLEQPPSDTLISIPAGQTVTQNINVTTSDATIKVTLKDPSGNLISSGFSFAHPIVGVVSTSGKDLFRGMGGPVNNGVALIRAVGGLTYGVGAGLPPEFSSNNFMSPQEQTVKLSSGQTAEVTLNFRAADGSVSGQVKTDAGSAPSFGYVGCWSEKGSNSGGPINGGKYSVNLGKDDAWHCRGNSRDGTIFYDSGEVNVITPSSTGFKLSQDFTLTKSTFVMPEPVSDTVDATQQKIINLSDGTSISIPVGAFAASGSFTFTATPTVNLTPSSIAKPLGFGYTLGVTNSSGTAVTTFNSAVTVTFPFDANSLTSQGLTAADLAPKYFDTTSNTWQDVTSATVNASSITFTTTHFTDFALVSSKGGSVKLTKVTTSVKNGQTTFAVGGKKVTPFSCKGSVRVETQAVSGTQYIAAGASCDSSLKLYDTKGKLLKSISTDWKGINSLAFTDATKDKQADVVIAGTGAKDVRVVDLTKKYKVVTVSVSTGKATLTAAVVDPSGKNPMLVVATVSGGRAGNFKLFSYNSKGGFSTTTSPYSTFLSNNNGAISLNVPVPTVTKVSGSVSTTSSSAKLTLTGTNLTPDMTIKVGAVSATVSWKSAASVVITVDGTKLTKGTAKINLTNPGQKAVNAKVSVTIK